MKKGQFIKICYTNSLKQIHSIQDRTVEYWSGGNLTKVYKENIEKVYDVDFSHLEEIK